MGHDDRQERRLGKFALKFGTVATAAAALVAEGTASAGESDLLKGILERNDAAPALARGRDEPAGLVPPPLVLKPSQAEPDWMLAGHRSHSSHSSHRSHSSHASGSSHASHYSASSHSSHYSSAVGSGFARPAPRPFPTGPTPPERAVPAPAPRVEPQPAPKVEAAPAIDPRDPLHRYELITFGTYQGVRKAFIKDHLTGAASLIKEGEKIGDCTLVEIIPQTDSVHLKPGDGEAFSIKRGRAGK